MVVLALYLTLGIAPNKKPQVRTISVQSGFAKKTHTKEITNSQKLVGGRLGLWNAKEPTKRKGIVKSG